MLRSGATAAGRRSQPGNRSSRETRRARETRLGETKRGNRAGAIEFGLQHGDFRVQYLGAADHAGAKSLVHHPARLYRGFDPFLRGVDGSAGGGDFKLPRLDLKGSLPVELVDACGDGAGTGGGLGPVGGPASTVPEGPRQVHRRVPRVLPAIRSREDPRVRLRVVVAAVEEHLWFSRGA